MLDAIYPQSSDQVKIISSNSLENSWCRHALHQSDYRDTSVNRGTHGCHCVGNVCMAFRTTLINKNDNTDYAGYCGAEIKMVIHIERV